MRIHRRLVVKIDRVSLFLCIQENKLIIKDNHSTLFDIDLDLIEVIKVERIVDQTKENLYEINIFGNFIELAKIPMHRKEAFQIQRWLEQILEQKKKNILFIDPEVQYRPHLFHTDWIDSIWQIGAVLLILSLSAYIFFVGLPRINHGKEKASEDLQSYQYFFEEGKRLIDLDRLTEGINYLEDAKNIKNTKEIQALLDTSYLERAEFYFQNKDFVKSLRDLKMIQKTSIKSEKLIALNMQQVNPIPFFSNKTVKNVQELLKNRWDLRWAQTKNREMDLTEWSGKKFDSDHGIIFTCSIFGIKEDQITKIIFKTELMQKDVQASYLLFEQISQDFLAMSIQFPDVKENQVQIEKWFSRWYPKVASSNYQIKEKIANMGFILMGEKGVRFLEINISEEKKSNP
jgi:hypothetical protein